PARSTAAARPCRRVWGCAVPDPADLSSHREGELEVAKLRVRWIGTGDTAGAGQSLWNERHRIDHRNSFRFDLARDPAQYRVVTEASDAGQHPERARIGGERIPQTRPRNSAGHGGPVDSAALKHLDDAFEFAHLNPGQLVDLGGKRGRGFVKMGDRDHANALKARSFCDLEREDTVACN